MPYFATAAHLASWAGVCPGNNKTAGKNKPGHTRPGDRWLQGCARHRRNGRHPKQELLYSCAVPTRRGPPRRQARPICRRAQPARRDLAHPEQPHQLRRPRRGLIPHPRQPRPQAPTSTHPNRTPRLPRHPRTHGHLIAYLRLFSSQLGTSSCPTRDLLVARRLRQLSVLAQEVSASKLAGAEGPIARRRT